MKEDPIVAEVRRVRNELSRKFNYDVSAIFADLRQRQQESGAHVVNKKAERLSAVGSRRTNRTAMPRKPRVKRQPSP